jgi:L-lactate utilization protein LutB
MTNTARGVLRKVFLQADMGISGVNLGVVDDGALCILTNEGNGRMVTTLPKIHVAIMGIERIVPSFDDLATMLYLLPRSATGQKITVYVNLLRSGNKKNGEVNSSRKNLPERHLILLDNGRERIRNAPLNDSLFCIRCGACLNACPVFREIGGHSYVSKEGEGSVYPGPIGSIISPALFGQEEYGHLARASTLCGACADACPVGIDLPKLLLRVRAGLINGQSTKAEKPNTPMALALVLKAFAWMATSQLRFSFAQKLAAWFGRIISTEASWVHLPDATGWGTTKDFPRPPAQTFHEYWANGQVRHCIDISVSKREVVKPQFRSGNDSIIQEGRSEKLTQVDLIKQFSDELTALEGKFVRCTRINLAEKITQYLLQQNIKRVQVGKSEDFPNDVENQLESVGIEVDYEIDPEIQVGISTALAGIAETGTLVLSNSDRNIAGASLLPAVHIAILDSESIVPKWRFVFEKIKEIEKESVVFISGPSRTADIEMTLTIGVHGPKSIYVFCVTPPWII